MTIATRIFGLKKRTIGIVLVILSMILVILWEIWGRTHLAYEEIIIAKQDIHSGTIITGEMLSALKEPKPSSGMSPEEANRIIGKEAIQNIPKGLEIREEFFSEPEFVKGNGKEITDIPLEWLATYPSTIMRGDRASVYNGKRRIADVVILHVKDGSNKEVEYLDFDRIEATSKPNSIEILADATKILEIVNLALENNKLALLIS